MGHKMVLVREDEARILLGQKEQLVSELTIANKTVELMAGHLQEFQNAAFVGKPSTIKQIIKRHTEQAKKELEGKDEN